jgi:hypothetical protein
LNSREESVPRQTGKGRRRRQAAFERRTTSENDFAGDAEGERTEATGPRREKMRESARGQEKPLGVLQGIATLALVPLRLAREVLRVPAEVFRILRHREA